MGYPKFRNQAALSTLLFLGVMVNISLPTLLISSSPLLATSDRTIKTQNIFSTSLKNSTHSPPPPNALVVTADATSLYANIPHEEIYIVDIHIVWIILDFILKQKTFKFMDTHTHQILGTSMGTRMALPYVILFMGKEECTIILTFLRLICFWKCFIDNIFFIFLGSHSQLNSLMTFINKISPSINYTVTYSE